ncbi:MAG: DUF445 domain-containing protein [Actinophytocola sp.]|nr:DUF445 domain-containing protein [Actinophytocola sp.]
MEAILTDLGEHWPIYLAIPCVAALIGYLTKRVAIALMFHPLNFAGFGRPFGLQGVVPRNAARLAALAAELLSSKLVEPRDLLTRLDADRLYAEVEQPLLTAIDHIARDVLAEQHPAAWESLPPLAQELAVKQIQAAAPHIVRRLLGDLREHADEIIDVKRLVIEQLAGDEVKLTRIVRELSRPEMSAIARSGAWLGFGIGLAQTVVWALTKESFQMPVFGAAIGLFTNWLALRLAFRPREPRTVLGRFTSHGYFHRRRADVAREYGQLIADEVLTVGNLLAAVLRGPRSDRTLALVQCALATAVAEQARAFRPLITATMGAEGIGELKRAAAIKAMPRIPDTTRRATGYLTEAMGVAELIERGVLALPPEEYENLLRPAFEQDRWRLVIVGGIVGAVVGGLPLLMLQ